MDKMEERTRQCILDLANLADRRGIITYTDFMNLNELNIFHSTVGKIPFVRWKLFGGYAKAERQLAAFIPDALYFRYDFSQKGDSDEDAIPFPIVCLQIRPLNLKFAEKLSHRDYLGAILNLGIDRSVTGDILIDEECAYLFCMQKIADFLCDNLTRIRHTTVLCQVFEGERKEIPLRTEKIEGTVASVRLDTLLALAWKTSRSSLVGMIEDGRVFVNGKCITSNGYHVKKNDLISARGMGRFVYEGMLSQTKKGRYLVKLEKYV